jgi:N,N'-diacetyllegionaminate synthase
MIERHFTVLDRDRTRDGRVSVNGDQVANIVKFAALDKIEQQRIIEKDIPDYVQMLGDGSDNLSAEELLNRDYYRGRFCTKYRGKEIFNWENIEVE